MRCMPGPPLPVSLNEDLANSIISIKNQVILIQFIYLTLYVAKWTGWVWLGKQGKIDLVQNRIKFGSTKRVGSVSLETLFFLHNM